MTDPADLSPTCSGDGASPVSTVRKYYQLVDLGDIPGLIELFAPDASYHRPGYPPMVGRAELERFYREQRVIESGSHVLTTVVAAGREVAVRGEFTGILRNGTRIDAGFADFFSLGRDGHFVRRDTFFFAPLV